MIVRLEGKIKYLMPHYAVVDVQGVGYKVKASPVFLASLLKDEMIVLHTSHQVREDAEDLYGFKTQTERDMFETLLTVSGIGPKSALGILTMATPGEIAAAVASGDAELFRRASKVGPKTAARAIVELKDKLELMTDGDQPMGAEQDDVLQALVSLGYQQKQVREALKKVNPEFSTAEKIKEALRQLGR